MVKRVDRISVLDRKNLIRKKELAEKVLITNNNLTAEERRGLLKIIHDVDWEFEKEEKIKKNSSDSETIGLGVLAFFFPLIGLVLYFVFLDTQPDKAKEIGGCALRGFAVGVILSTILCTLTLLGFFI